MLTNINDIYQLKPCFKSCSVNSTNDIWSLKLLKQYFSVYPSYHQHWPQSNVRFLMWRSATKTLRNSVRNSSDSSTSDWCDLHHVTCCPHSKAARRKKREEAQKLPEVSSDIFYEVSGDLKAVFGQTKEELSEAEEENNWDQEEEEEDGGEEEELQTSLLPDDPITTKEESSGFKFSFFGVDGETSSRETSKRSWSEPDPLFMSNVSRFLSFNSRVQSGEHPGSKGVLAARPSFP